MPAVFCDVDDTLVRGVTLFQLLRHDALETDRVAEGETFLADLRARRLMGVVREETNRRYFAWWRGRREDDVRDVGRRWFDSLDLGAVLNRAVQARLRSHLDAGDRVVLVSGSFGAALDPLSEHLGGCEVLCTEVDVMDGFLTGRATPLVGDQKAGAVAGWAHARGIDLDACSALGDHESDLPVLRLVGSPVVVGTGDTLLQETADRHGWERLP